MKTKIIDLILILACIASGSCASTLSSLNDGKEFEQIKIGDPASYVEKVLGPAKYSYEKHPTGKYKTLNYNDDKDQPKFFFTLDQKGIKVVGKSKWIYQNDTLYKPEYTLNEQFKGVTFKKYVPCQTRSDQDQILISEQNGLYIAREENNIALISWATPELTRIRAEHILQKCPRLQK